LHADQRFARFHRPEFSELLSLLLPHLLTVNVKNPECLITEHSCPIYG
jgi:hypothetical protein